MSLPPPLPPTPPLPPRTGTNPLPIVLLVAGGIVALIFVVAIVAAFVFPVISAARLRAQSAQAVTHSREIYFAMMQMASDTGPNPGWPGDLAASATPVNTLDEYVQRLADGKYLKPEELAVLFHAPGLPAYPGTGPLTSEFSAFKIYRAKTADGLDCLALATKNFTLGTGLVRGVAPFSSRAGVVVTKDGNAHLLSAATVQRVSEKVTLPGGGTGPETRESTLR